MPLNARETIALIRQLWRDNKKPRSVLEREAIDRGEDIAESADADEADDDGVRRHMYALPDLVDSADAPMALELCRELIHSDEPFWCSLGLDALPELLSAHENLQLPNDARERVRALLRSSDDFFVLSDVARLCSELKLWPEPALLEAIDRPFPNLMPTDRNALRLKFAEAVFALEDMTPSWLADQLRREIDKLHVDVSKAVVERLVQARRQGINGSDELARIIKEESVHRAERIRALLKADYDKGYAPHFQRYIAPVMEMKAKEFAPLKALFIELCSANEDWATRAVQVLGMFTADKECAAALLHALVHHPSSVVRLRAVWAWAEKSKDPEPLLQVVEREPAKGVRLDALHAALRINKLPASALSAFEDQVLKHGVMLTRTLYDNILQAFKSGGAAAVKRFIGELGSNAPRLELKQLESNGGGSYFFEAEALEHLKQYAPEAHDLLEARVWPPKGWKGADKDAEVALKIAELLESAVESSDIDSRFYAFALPPEADADDNQQEDDDDDSDEEVFLSVIDEDDRESAEEEHGKGKWWREYWGKDEYKARKQASAFMAKTLTGIWREDRETGPATSIVFYQGRSKTGALVGVLAMRSDS